jgi:hypothetical protein
MSPLGGVQIYERQLVEGAITATFQEARKVVDRLVTAPESVVYTLSAAIRFHWQRWRGTGCDSHGIFTRSGASQGYCIRDLRRRIFWTFGTPWHGNGVMPTEHTLSPELRSCIDPSGSQSLFPVGRNLPSGHPGHFVRSLILLSL